jgi:predicted phage tail protein
LVYLSAGILQLALLAPYSSLASSVAAALVPTLLTPKIRITDENDQTFSFGSDSNSLPMDTNQQQGKVYWNFT